MAYSPPNSFSNGTALTASDLTGNDQALRVYLHEGVVDADLLSSTPWIETRHIQTPTFDPIVGVQHAVTGLQGSQWSGGFGVRAQFATTALTGNRKRGSSTELFEYLPQTSMTLDIRDSCIIIMHWWMETFNGPDSRVDEGAQLYVGEYAEQEQFASGRLVPATIQHAVCSANNEDATVPAPLPPPSGWLDLGSSTIPVRIAGPARPYTLRGLGNMSGTNIDRVSAGGKYRVGLSFLTSIDPSCIINWCVNIEAYYTSITLD